MNINATTRGHAPIRNKRLIRYKGNDITFRQIDKEFLVGFIEFLNKDTRDFDKDTVGRVARPISSGYKVVLFARVMMVLNMGSQGKHNYEEPRKGDRPKAQAKTYAKESMLPDN